MTPDRMPEVERPPEDGLVDYLVEQCGLPEESAGQIRDIMRSERLRSTDAAAISGLLTADQAEEVIKWSESHPERQRDGVIEAALRRSGGPLVAKSKVVEGPELKPGPQLQFAHDPYSARSEKIRGLRTELLLLNNTASLTLAVVGSGQREGRSLLAAELALAFGQLGGRTLLVDADMRKPSQHLLFQTKNTFGLAHSIDGRHPEMRYRIAGFPAMSLLTAGTAPSNPLELLSDARFERLNDLWRKQFEFIIVDTPPISLFADGLTVATQTGRVLVVSRSVATTFRDLKDMLRRLSMTQSQVLGAVINDF